MKVLKAMIDLKKVWEWKRIFMFNFDEYEYMGKRYHIVKKGKKLEFVEKI